MNRRILLPNLAALGVLCLTATPGKADGQQLSSERLDMVEKMGYFTPGFKAAVHSLVDAKQALEEAKSEKAAYTKELPALQKQATEAQAQAVALRQELAKYDHPDETDFAALQQKINDPATKPDDLIALAQAYAWTYPTSPHAGEAQQYLLETQKAVANAQEAVKEAEAARAAAHAKLVQRAQARDLNLSEWRDFLRDMSQDDLVKLFGRPSSETDGYWIYSGDWIVKNDSGQKVGMQINFSGGRVISVDEKPSTP
jgi:hypothetical protein